MRKDFEEEQPYYKSPAEKKLSEILNRLGLWYRPQYEEGRFKLDFFIVSPFGNRYDLEVDGRQHWAPEQLSRDEVRDNILEEAGYNVIRINAKQILSQQKKIEDLLSKLI